MHLRPSILIPLLALVLSACDARVVTVGNDASRTREQGPVFAREGADVRHGMWTGTHANGQRAWKVRYVRGTPVGLRREWHENGARAAEIKLGWDGKPLEERGAVKRWNPDGSVIEPPKNEEKSHG